MSGEGKHDGEREYLPLAMEVYSHSSSGLHDGSWSPSATEASFRSSSGLHDGSWSPSATEASFRTRSPDLVSSHSTGFGAEGERSREKKFVTEMKKLEMLESGRFYVVSAEEVPYDMFEKGAGIIAMLRFRNTDKTALYLGETDSLPLPFDQKISRLLTYTTTVFEGLCYMNHVRIHPGKNESGSYFLRKTLCEQKSSSGTKDKQKSSPIYDDPFLLPYHLTVKTIDGPKTYTSPNFETLHEIFENLELDFGY
jgi:hypothetical protein